MFEKIKKYGFVKIAIWGVLGALILNILVAFTAYNSIPDGLKELAGKQVQEASKTIDEWNNLTTKEGQNLQIEAFALLNQYEMGINEKKHLTNVSKESILDKSDFE